MSTVIKSNQRPPGVGSVAFNFDDMAAQAGRYLDQVREQAAQIIAEAQRQAEQVRRQAEEQGRAAAHAEQQQRIEQEVGRRMETVLPALRETVKQIHDARHAWTTHWEQAAVHVATRIAARVCRRQLSFTPEIPLALVKEALELAAGSADIRVYISPQDHQALGGQIERLIEEIADLGATQLVPDPKLTPGGCRVETRAGAIDQTFAAQLDRIEEELGP